MRKRRIDIGRDLEGGNRRKKNFFGTKKYHVGTRANFTENQPEKERKKPEELKLLG